eukprot:6203631-Pleurochrysis_carterae.AAC.1
MPWCIVILASSVYVDKLTSGDLSAIGHFLVARAPRRLHEDDGGEDGEHEKGDDEHVHQHGQRGEQGGDKCAQALHALDRAQRPHRAEEAQRAQRAANV